MQIILDGKKARDDNNRNIIKISLVVGLYSFAISMEHHFFLRSHLINGMLSIIDPQHQHGFD
jgi:hypothetical protein